MCASPSDWAEEQAVADDYNIRKAFAGEPEAVTQTDAPAVKESPTITQDSGLRSDFSSATVEASPPQASAQLNIPGIGAFSFTAVTQSPTPVVAQTSGLGTGGFTFVPAALPLSDAVSQSNNLDAGSFGFAPAAPFSFQGWSPNPTPDQHAAAQNNNVGIGSSFTFATPSDQGTVPEYDTGMDDVRNDHVVASSAPPESFDDDEMTEAPANTVVSEVANTWSTQVPAGDSTASPEDTDMMDASSAPAVQDAVPATTDTNPVAVATEMETPMDLDGLAEVPQPPVFYDPKKTVFTLLGTVIAEHTGQLNVAFPLAANTMPAQH
jgi:hypothetical protein